MTNPEIIHFLATRLIERVEALGLKGKKADNTALDYFIGAANLAEATGDEALSKHLAMIAGMNIAIRGMFGVRELVAKS